MKIFQLFFFFGCFLLVQDGFGQVQTHMIHVKGTNQIQLEVANIGLTPLEFDFLEIYEQGEDNPVKTVEKPTMLGSGEFKVFYRSLKVNPDIFYKIITYYYDPETDLLKNTKWQFHFGTISQK